MITQCRFCDFYREKQLNTDIMYLMQDVPAEDIDIWLKRLIKQSGSYDYNSVKIHMGIKHKDKTYKGILPKYAYDDTEIAYINKLSKTIAGVNR